MRNLITDVQGVSVGSAHESRAATGFTVVPVAATGSAGPPHSPPGGDPMVLAELGTVAADGMARAVARGVYEATALPYKTSLPDWKSRFGGDRG